MLRVGRNMDKGKQAFRVWYLDQRDYVMNIIEVNLYSSGVPHHSLLAKCFEIIVMTISGV